MSNFYGGEGNAALTSNRDDWETPRWLFEAVDAIWHFDLDPASNDANSLCELHYTREQDGLAQSWEGHRVFLNPPYGKDMGAWMKKAAAEAEKPDTIVVCLVPARTDTRWWWDNVVPNAAEVSYIRGRLKFEIGGRPLSAAPFPSALVRFGGALPSSNRPTEAGRQGR